MPRFDPHDENAQQPAGQEKEKDMTSNVIPPLQSLPDGTFAWWFVRTAKWCGGYGILSRVVST